MKQKAILRLALLILMFIVSNNYYVLAQVPTIPTVVPVIFKPFCPDGDANGDYYLSLTPDAYYQLIAQSSKVMYEIYNSAGVKVESNTLAVSYGLFSVANSTTTQYPYGRWALDNLVFSQPDTYTIKFIWVVYCKNGVIMGPSQEPPTINGSTNTDETPTPEDGQYGRLEYPDPNHPSDIYAMYSGETQPLQVVVPQTSGSGSICGNFSNVTGGVLIAESNLTSCSGGVNISSGSNVTVQAQQSIIINPGFFADQGSVFSSSIISCPGSARKEAKLLQDVATGANTDLVLAPNPSTSYTNLLLNNKNEVVVNVQIFDANGSKIIEESGNIATLNTTALNNGIYYIKVVTNLNNYQKKLVVQK